MIESYLLLQLVSLALRRADVGGARQHLAVALDLAIAVASPSLQIEGVASFAESRLHKAMSIARDAYWRTPNVIRPRLQCER